MKVFRSVEKSGRRIDFWTARGQVSSDERRKKVGTEGCIWDPALEINFMHEGEWLRGGYARAGVSAVVIGKNIENETVAILNRFDSGHPTRGGQLTPPAGLWDSDVSLKDGGLTELGEEVIVKSDGKIGHWNYEDRPLSLYWVEQYARDNGFKLATETIKGIEIMDMSVNIGNIFDIYLDGVYQGRALLASEPDTGSVEIIFLFTTETVLCNDMFADGEMDKGRYLGREVGVFTAEMLEGEKLTSKAQIVRDFLYSL